VSAVAVNSLPTLSQLHGWETSHLTDAGSRWKSAADTWTSVYGEVAEGLRTPAGTTWEGAASQAALARAARDRTGVGTVADRLTLGVQVAGNGAAVINAAKQRALRTIAMANVMGFDVKEDLSVVDRMPLVDPERTRQGLLLAVEVKRAAAQLAAIDQQVGADLSTVTKGFDALDFKQEPVIEPLDTESNPDFGKCWSDEFKDEVGPAMVRGAFTGGLTGAVIGGIGGFFFGGPFGAAGGIVLGFVGGAAKGVLITGPLEAAGKSAWDCW
jgi:hypothetical protein